MVPLMRCKMPTFRASKSRKQQSGGVMTTTVLEARTKRLDHYFFPGMALLILATVFLGFAQSYYLAGMFRAPLPNSLTPAWQVFATWTLNLARAVHGG